MQEETMFNPTVQSYIQQRTGEFETIPAERRERLGELAGFVEQRLGAGQTAKLTFICTHNSRRSHFAQLWARAAADYFGVPDVATFSGGTEATAFNPRAVAAMRRAGFVIDQTTDDSNPVYEVRYTDTARPMQAFSKVYNEFPNPGEDFCAVMTCGDADANCPVVPGAARRVAIPYEDPKNYDDTEREQSAYDERCAQIGREMLYLFSLVTVNNAEKERT
ncbi:protein-tyrosine-phosphatase [candidate division GN15 bacterium]|nr:protein-tyrosine-phosphatase [candidate division GN15 bacterium]